MNVDKMNCMSSQEYELVTDVQGRYIYSDDGGRILVKLKNEDTLMYVQCEEAAGNDSGNEPESQQNTTAEVDIEDNNCNRSWTRDEIMMLIHLYKVNRQLFQSSTVKNEKVWKQISVAIQTHSPAQCENKFKYLKARYIKKVENMGPRKTGEASVKFDYFDDFHAIFGKEPNIKPVAVASTLTLPNSEATQEDSVGNTNQQADKECASSSKKSKSTAQSLLEIQKTMQLKEDGKQRRHQESMKLKQEALSTFKEYMDKMMEK